MGCLEAGLIRFERFGRRAFQRDLSTFVSVLELVHKWPRRMVLLLEEFSLISATAPYLCLESQPICYVIESTLTFLPLNVRWISSSCFAPILIVNAEACMITCCGAWYCRTGHSWKKSKERRKWKRHGRRQIKSWIVCASRCVRVGQVLCCYALHFCASDPFNPLTNDGGLHQGQRIVPPTRYFHWSRPCL